MKMAEIGAAKFNVTKSVRIDSEMANELDLIALFIGNKPSQIMREWVQDKILTYQRNPKYKWWRKQLKEKRGKIK